MNKMIGMTFGVFAVVAPTLAIIPTTRDEIHWRWASHKDETASYQSYTSTWPDGRHVAEAQMRYDERDWTNARAVNTVHGFERYLQQHGEGRHATEARDNIDILHWREATKANTPGAFERYLERHGEGRYVTKARDGIEALRWQEASRANTPEALARYLDLHGQGRHATEAADRIEAIHWQKATTTGTIKSYQAYCAARPDGQHAEEAKAKIAALRTDNTPFGAAMRVGTKAAIEQFLADYPGHQKETHTRQLLKDIGSERNLVELFREEKIDMVAFGKNIRNVSLRIRKLTPYPLAVRIPAGTFFVAADSAAQDMVATADRTVQLTANTWQTTMVPVACANRARRIPSSEDSFAVRRAPYNGTLAKLMPALAEANASLDTRQAAVWIVTDNASYKELGSLVTSSWGSIGSSRTRAIGPHDAAHAMKICDEAGIDIVSRAVWQDRDEIMTSLQECEANWPKYKELRLWLLQKQQDTWRQHTQQTTPAG